MKHSKLILFGFCALIASACAKDRNLDDAKRDQVNQDLAKLQAVAGTYSGHLTRTSDKTNMGALQIKLNAQTRPLDSKDETKASSQPILASEVSFAGDPVSFIESTASFNYDDNLNHFSADIPVTDVNKVVHTMHLEGALNRDGTMSGTMVIIGFQEMGGSFSLTRGSTSLEALNKAMKPGQVSAFGQTSFTGITTFSDGTTKPANLVLIPGTDNSDEDALSLLAPMKSFMTASLSYGTGASFDFTNVIWDEGRNQLIATASPVTGPLRLTCTPTPSKGFQCQLSTSLATANLTVKPGTTVGVNKPDPRNAIVRQYTADAKIKTTDDAGRPIIVTRATTMTVTWPSRTRQQEILDLLFPNPEHVVKVVFGPKGTNGGGTGFTQAKWDSRAGTLDGDSNPSNANAAATLSLQCDNFYFYTARNYDFTCHETGGLSNTDVTVRFQSR